MPPESILAVPCGRRESHPDPVTLPEAFLVVFGECPIRHMTGDFHCKDGRQEVEWKPGLSAASLNMQPAARPSHCQQAQLGWALRRLVQWGLHVVLRQEFQSTECRGVCGEHRPPQFYCHKCTRQKGEISGCLRKSKCSRLWRPYCSRPTHAEAFVTKDDRCTTNELAS